MGDDAGLTDRQKREVDYHRDYAAKQAEERLQPVNFDVIEPGPRRPHNAFWSAYDRVLAHDWKGKRALVPGCGFGEDAIRLSRLGADVYAFDISDDILAITRRRIAEFGYGDIKLDVMPCEAMTYADDFFDAIFFVDILHHVDIPKSAAEMQRVAKKGASLIGNELYTHSALQKNIRESWIVDKAIYPAMKKFVYGGREPYITEDEHKIDEDEFAALANVCESLDAQWFNGMVGRLAPDTVPGLPQLDRTLMKALGANGRFAAGRVVFEGVVAKP